MLRRAWTKQWSFFWAGVAFGIAQIIYMIANYIHYNEIGKTLVSKPITVTTNLGRMFHGMEVFWLGNHPFGLEQGLYGAGFKNQVDAWGPIMGMILGGFLVAMAEKESRSWARYSGKMLGVSFIGGMLFSYGTRLAGGCTLNHLLGGIPLMSIKSTIVALFMSVGGLTAFFAMSKIGVGPYFKHQETKSYAQDAQKRGLLADGLTLVKGYNPWKDPIRWVGLAFLFLFLVPAIYYFFFGKGELVHNSIPNKGAVFMFLTLFAGVVGGFGMAKSGFGTECALISVEAQQLIKKDEKKFMGYRIPAITRSLFKGLLPLQGLLASIVLTGVFAVGAWVLFDVGLSFRSPVKNELSIASMIGGLFLGAGAVMLIGCEIRSYMRLGLSYTNTLIGFIGFAIGYLPYTLLYDQHKAFLKDSVLLHEKYMWYEVFFPNNVGAQKAFAVVWTLALVLLLLWAIRAGAKALKLGMGDVINNATEDVEMLAEQAGAVPLPEGAGD